ncbi:glycosyltransferase [Candidatus Pelagibacter sp. HIMB109]|uniref:glycosyltransferase n=1 Tax=Candidatus Pelagibacter sp. HIMB109 TaxID=3415412 RepID=UPI003F871757
MDKKRAIILPYKESFGDKNSGAASIFVKESLVNENVDQFVIYGSKSIVNAKYKKNYFYNPVQKKYFRNYNYIKYFIKKFSHFNFETIEIHNRPEYIKEIKKNFPTSKIIFFFHNDPNTLRGSKKNEEKKYIYNNCHIVFLSKWIQKKFENKKFINKKNIVIYPGVKQSNYKKKQKIIFFCGKLNHSKGYDVFIQATKKIKKIKKFSDWKIISAGTESRRVIPVEDHIKELGQISNKQVYNIYEKALISIAPSNWEEPLGRLPIESAAHGSISITSDKGGLPETNHHGYILKDNSSKELFELLVKLLSNSKKLHSLSKKIYNSFDFTNEKFLKSISNLRYRDEKVKKVFLISNLNLKNKKRLFYSFFNKLKLGLKKYPLKLISISDRDFIRDNRGILDISGIKSFNKAIINKVKLFNPDLIILGHTDRIEIKTFEKIRSINNDIKIIKIFIDSISNEFFKFKKVFYEYKFLNNIFISSNPKMLKEQDLSNKIKFIPYPVDKKIDNLKSFNLINKQIDVFFALSHGQNRGILKKGKIDEREEFLSKLKVLLPDHVKCNFIGINNAQPVWGNEFYNRIKNSKILINLSRGKYKKHYSSDRISSLIGNGCFVLNEKKNLYSDFFDKKNELINFTTERDLKNKILYYLDKPKLRKIIASNCYQKYHAKINTSIIINYILDVIFKKKIRKKYLWT